MIEQSEDAAAKRPNFFAEMKRRNVIRTIKLTTSGGLVYTGQTRPDQTNLRRRLNEHSQHS